MTKINPHQKFTLYGIYRVGVSLMGVSITLVKVVEPDAIMQYLSNSIMKPVH